MKKDYMDYDKINDKLIYTDKDYEITNEDSKNLEEINVLNDENKPNIINNINQKQKLNEIINTNNIKENEKDNKINLNINKNKYFCENFEYKSNNLKKVSFKIIFKKIINKILNFMYISLRFILVFSIISMSSIFITILTNNFKNNQTKEVTQETTIITEEAENTEDIKDTYINNIQTETIIKYLSDLNNIIIGEKECLNNLNENLISKNDTYNYFMKSLDNKNLLLKKINGETSIKNQKQFDKIKIIIQNSINFSKSIINRFLLSEKKETMINDMNTFDIKYKNDIKELQEMLNKK